MTTHVLVSGATGAQGGAVARRLLARGHRVRAMTRNPGGAAAVQLADRGAELAEADFDAPETVRRALSGVDTVFAMGTPFGTDPQTETRQATGLADAAVEAGVGHLVYSSVASAREGTGVPHFESKAQVERHLETLPIPHTVVAPVAFLDNIDSPWTRSDLARGRHTFGLPADVPLQRVAVADIASFATLVVEQPERFRGSRVELASVQATGAEVAAVLSRRLERAVEYVEVPLTAFEGEHGDPDLLAMLRFFRDPGYAVDIAALHAAYPEVDWHTVDGWARAHDWSAVLSAG